VTQYILRRLLLMIPVAFLVTVGIYSFTTAAMLVPALYEFDIAMGRAKAAGEE
jgi:hypothetical protein